MLFIASIIIILVFLFVNVIIFSAKDVSNKLAPIILESRDEYVGNIKFEHYFLANKGIFVSGVQHRPAMLLYSSVFSFCGLFALIFAAINFYYHNYIFVGIMLLIAVIVFFSKTGSWFPHADNGICIKRTIANYAQTYPEDFNDNNPLTQINPLGLAMFYDAAISISEIYFFGQEQS